jgi:hypothetical protein
MTISLQQAELGTMRYLAWLIQANSAVACSGRGQPLTLGIVSDLSSHMEQVAVFSRDSTPTRVAFLTRCLVLIERVLEEYGSELAQLQSVLPAAQQLQDIRNCLMVLAPTTESKQEDWRRHVSN